MSDTKKAASTALLRWGPLALVCVLLIVAVLMRSSVLEVGEESREVVKTTARVDSLESLKTITITLSNQYVQAEQSWSSALSFSLFFLFLTLLVTIFLSVRIHSLETDLKEIKKRLRD